jgi:hypothetical protein
MPLESFGHHVAIIQVAMDNQAAHSAGIGDAGAHCTSKPPARRIWHTWWLRPGCVPAIIRRRALPGGGGSSRRREVAAWVAGGAVAWH